MNRKDFPPERRICLWHDIRMVGFAVGLTWGLAVGAAEKQTLLKVSLNCTQPWSPCVLGPEKAVKYPKVPESVSIFLTPEPGCIVKPFIYIRDTQGEIFNALYMMDTSELAPGGEARKVKIPGWEWIQVGDQSVVVNGKVDPPVELYGLGLPCRKNATMCFQVGPISLDDTVVEDFAQDNQWHPWEVGEGVKVELARSAVGGDGIGRAIPYGI